jgi:hypothetical protein
MIERTGMMLATRTIAGAAMSDTRPVMNPRREGLIKDMGAIYT